MDNKEMEKLEEEELDRTAVGADTPEQLAFWEYRDEMVAKYGSVEKIPQGEELNKFYDLKRKGINAYRHLEAINVALERGELHDGRTDLNWD